MYDPNRELYNSVARKLGRGPIIESHVMNMAFVALWATADNLIDWGASLDIVLDNYGTVGAIYEESISPGWENHQVEDRFYAAIKPLEEFEDSLFIVMCVIDAFAALEGSPVVDNRSDDIQKLDQHFAEFRAKLEAEFKQAFAS